MRTSRLPGFTLVEIMLVAGLTGIIAAAAVAPIIFTVRSLERAQREWGGGAASRKAADGIFLDIRNSIKNPSFSSVKFIHKEGLKIEHDDRLLVWTASPLKINKPAGLVVYRLVEKSVMDKNVKPGLYRWVINENPKSDDILTEDDIFSGSEGGSNTYKTPMDTDPDMLKAAEGKLVMPNADGVLFQVWGDGDWESDWDGDMPSAVKVIVNAGSVSFDYEEWFPTL